jgi:hypothetical protein
MQKCIRTVKPVHYEHLWDSKIVAVIDSWSLFRGHLCSIIPIRDFKMEVVIDRWLLAQV